MKRSKTRHLAVLASAVLLLALVTALALPGSAAASRRVPASSMDVSPPITTDNSAAVGGGFSTLVFTAVDFESGVAATYYSIDGHDWIEASAVNFTRAQKRGGLKAGPHTIAYFSVDMFGNTELARSCTVTL